MASGTGLAPIGLGQCRRRSPVLRAAWLRRGSAPDPPQLDRSRPRPAARRAQHRSCPAAGQAVDSFLQLRELQEAISNRLSELAIERPDAEREVLHTAVFEDPDLSARRDELLGDLFGLDLFDVEKVTGLPPALVGELAWSPGEDHEFFAPGDFRGWPLRVWPTMKRPFICLAGRVFAFDVFVLFDNFYRVLQRVIFRLAPGLQRDLECASEGAVGGTTVSLPRTPIARRARSPAGFL